MNKMRTFEYRGMTITAAIDDEGLCELVFKNPQRDCAFVVPIDILAYEFTGKIEAIVEALP